MSGCEKWMIAISSVQDAGEKLRSMRFIAECPKMLEHLQSGKSMADRASSISSSPYRAMGYLSSQLTHLSKPFPIHPLVLQMQIYSKGPARRSKTLSVSASCLESFFLSGTGSTPLVRGEIIGLLPVYLSQPC